MKNEFQREIQSLIDHLEKSEPDVESTESVAIEYLTCLLKNAENSGTMDMLNKDMAELRRFWLESVPWCSQLSSQIEKIIILHDELNEQANNE